MGSKEAKTEIKALQAVKDSLRVYIDFGRLAMMETEKKRKVFEMLRERRLNELSRREFIPWGSR